MRTAGRRSPALVELILVILFFSLSAVILVQVFVKAKDMSEMSRAKTQSMILAQDLIEQWKADPTDPEELFSEQKGWIKEPFEEESEDYLISADSGMQFAQEGEEGCKIQVKISEELWTAGTLYWIQVTIVRNRDHKLITELETAKYIPHQEVMS